ncbi:MAG: phosphatidate cytidylyltransferase [Desulfobacterales bacterium]|nr:phosphatidate cytidylyltransferase [Desulfobacterales bacterium]
MHLKRWLTSIVAVPILAVFLYKAPASLFSAFIGLLAVISLGEYYRIVYKPIRPAVGLIIPLWGGFVGVLLLFTAYASAWHVIPELIIVNTLVTAFLSIPRFKIHTGVVDVVSKEIQGLIYIPLALATLILLRMEPNGVRWIFFLVTIVFAGDVGAFYAGRLFGRHKLSPAVSPGKTVEGAVGGLLTNVIVGYAFMRLFIPHLSVAGSLFFFIAVGVAGQVGDLFESEFKRVQQVKDSGAILPGHGGLLDRIDALLFAAPTAYLVKTYFLGGF